MYSKSFQKEMKSDLHHEWRRVTTLMAVPAALLYSFFFIVPVALGIWYSLTDWNGIARTNNFVGLQNYVDALTSNRFLTSILFNLRYTVIYVLCVLVLSVLIAILLNQRVRGNTIFRALLFLPAIFSGVTISLIYQQIFFRVIPSIADSLGIASLHKSILSSRDTAIYGVLLVHLWCSLPLQSIMVLAGLQTVPEELLDAAKIDGAKRAQLFRYITIPYLVPVLSVVLVLAVKGGLMIFDLIKVLTDGGPNNATRSVSILIYNNAFKNNKYALAMAEAIIVGVMIAVISLAQLKISQNKSANS